MNLQKHLDIVKYAAIVAGQEIMEIYRTDFEKDIQIKADDSPLTLADNTSNDIIIRILKREFPEISILSEENKTDLERFDNDYCWIIDPLDGTKEFIKKNDEFTVNIALSYKNSVILGVIYVPVTKTLYYASQSQGAYKEIQGKRTRIGVTDKLTDLILVGSKSHASEKLETLMKEKADIISKTVSVGSSLKGIMVAEGEADIYYRFGYTSEWDTAAMQCIVEEAGGIFKQMDGSEMKYNRHDSLNRKGFFVVNCEKNIWMI